MRDVETGESVWLIVNIDLLFVPLWLPLLAGDNCCIWDKKDRIIYCVRCQEGCTVCLFTQAGTDWQLPLAEPLPITSIVQSNRHHHL